MKALDLLPSALIGAVASARSMTPMAALATAELAHKPLPGRVFLLNRPLFKFGHGLSYTSFRVEEAACTGDTLTDNGALTFSWTRRNTGARAGAGTVFVFVSRAGEPLKQLRQLLGAPPSGAGSFQIY